MDEGNFIVLACFKQSKYDKNTTFIFNDKEDVDEVQSSPSYTDPWDLTRVFFCNLRLLT